MKRQTNKAFTLVELLVVIAVIAILVTLIIGVSKKVSSTRQGERTRLTMTQVMDAIEVLTLADPDHKAPPEWWTDPPPPYWPTTKSDGTPLPRPVNMTDPGFNPYLNQPSSIAKSDWEAYARCGFLTWQLTQLVPQAKAKVPSQSEAYTFVSISSGTAKYPAFCQTKYYNPDYTDSRAFADGFGKYLDYRAAGGVGGTPLLISAGPDGIFNTEDDIRSDRR